ncbi:TlpA family protein disulfide reductase [Pasteurella sp. PK-2025]|uniref:TlpA family protein disulfide reductase n=1 Tax=Pasteurella sp. PK-2025 TaxID=3413133 RepID=UPI003C7361CF
MKTKIVLTALYRFCLLSSIGLLFACQEQKAEIGHTAPDIAAFDLQGQPVQLTHQSGHTTLLTFWSETCGVCVGELKTLEQLAQQYPQHHLNILAINVDGDKGDTQAIVKQRDLHLPIVKDQLKITAERYQLLGTPTSFVIDQTGKILYKFDGLIPTPFLHSLFQGQIKGQ